MKKLKDVLMVGGFMVVVIMALSALIMGISAGDRQRKKDIDEGRIINGYEVRVIDGCEYLVGYREITHKGNCRFCSGSLTVNSKGEDNGR